jgi:hypothetical protein
MTTESTEFSISSISFRSINDNNPILSFTVNGDPPVQERSRVGRLLPNKKLNIYDPSGLDKKNGLIPYGIIL